MMPNTQLRSGCVLVLQISWLRPTTKLSVPYIMCSWLRPTTSLSVPYHVPLPPILVETYDESICTLEWFPGSSLRRTYLYPKMVSWFIPTTNSTYQDGTSHSQPTNEPMVQTLDINIPSSLVPWNQWPCLASSCEQNVCIPRPQNTGICTRNLTSNFKIGNLYH